MHRTFVSFTLTAVKRFRPSMFFRYPLGRVIGGTVYPGLTLTAGTLWRCVFENLN